MAFRQITQGDVGNGNRIIIRYNSGYVSEGENFRAPGTDNSPLENFYFREETVYDETGPPLSISVRFGDYPDGQEANRVANERDGLTEEIISQCVKSRHCQDGDMMEICVVCQSKYEKGEMLGTLACGHEYHGSCIRRCLMVKDSCPICRQKAHRPGSY